MGTPHRGSAYANIGLIATKIASRSGFNVNDRNVRDLRGDTGMLLLLRQEFGKMLDAGKFLVSTFQEAQGISRFGPLSARVSCWYYFEALFDHY